MQCTKLYRISALVKLISYHFDDELCFLCSTRELWMLGLLVINIHGLPGTMTPGNGWGWESLTSTPNSVLVTNRFEEQGTLILLILAPSTFAITTSASGSVFFNYQHILQKKRKKVGSTANYMIHKRHGAANCFQILFHHIRIRLNQDSMSDWNIKTKELFLLWNIPNLYWNTWRAYVIFLSFIKLYISV